jgi:hypothetical protein
MATGDVAFREPDTACLFEKWFVGRGAEVHFGDPIALTKYPSGEFDMVIATHDGVIQALQPLERGDRIADRIIDGVIAVATAHPKLPRLQYSSPNGEVPVRSLPGNRFIRWAVEEGARVRGGDPMAMVFLSNHLEQVVRAPANGLVTQLLELHVRENIDDHVDDRVIAVILQTGTRCPGEVQVMAEAIPEGCTFKTWVATPGEEVWRGQVLGLFADQHGNDVEIRSPCWGIVQSERTLSAGDRLDRGVLDSAIAVVTNDISFPLSYWMLLLAFIFSSSALGVVLMVTRKDDKDADYVRVLPPLREVVEFREEPDEPAATPSSSTTCGGCMSCNGVPESAVRFDFDDNLGNIVPVFFENRPLGVNFEPQAPIRVHSFKFNSYAKAVGVKPGWTLVQVDDQDVSNGLDVEAVKAIIHRKIRTFPVWPLRLEFTVPLPPAPGTPFIGRVTASTQFGSEHRIFDVDKRPIGLEFHHRPPIVVNKVYPRSFAHAYGIEENWKIVRIGERRSETFDYEEVMRLLREGMETLELGEW